MKQNVLKFLFLLLASVMMLAGCGGQDTVRYKGQGSSWEGTYRADAVKGQKEQTGTYSFHYRGDSREEIKTFLIKVNGPGNVEFHGTEGLSSQPLSSTIICTVCAVKDISSIPVKAVWTDSGGEHEESFELTSQ